MVIRNHQIGEAIGVEPAGSGCRRSVPGWNVGARNEGYVRRHGAREENGYQRDETCQLLLTSVAYAARRPAEWSNTSTIHGQIFGKIRFSIKPRMNNPPDSLFR